MYRALCEATARTCESPGRLRRYAPYKGLVSPVGSVVRWTCATSTHRPLAPLRGYPCALAGKVHPLRVCTFPTRLSSLFYCLDGADRMAVAAVQAVFLLNLIGRPCLDAPLGTMLGAGAAADTGVCDLIPFPRDSSAASAIPPAPAVWSPDRPAVPRPAGARQAAPGLPVSPPWSP